MDEAWLHFWSYTNDKSQGWATNVITPNWRKKPHVATWLQKTKCVAIAYGGLVVVNMMELNDFFQQRHTNRDNKWINQPKAK